MSSPTSDITIIPAVLPSGYEALVSSLSHLRHSASMVQIDVCDGKFVPSVTFPFARGDDPFWKNMHTQNDGLPFWEEFDFEADVMVSNPEVVAREWISAGVSSLIVHAKSSNTLESLIDECVPLVSVGLAVPSRSRASEYTALVSKVSFVQVMGIARVGFQGEPFDEHALETIADFKKTFPGVPIQVDGGVSLSTVRSLVEAGARRLVSGTFVLSALSASEAVEQLKTEGALGLKS